MNFDKSRVYTSLNADELRVGDKVICADDMGHLKHYVTNNGAVLELKSILDENNISRFIAGTGKVLFHLAYLVERKENCTNCERLDKTCNSREDDKITCCFDYKSKTEQKAEKHYRSFRDVDELIEECDKKLNYRDPTGLAMPYIWVKYKYNEKSKGSLITDFSDDQVVLGDKEEDYMTMYDLFDNYTFLDGSPCGVEE